MSEVHVFADVAGISAVEHQNLTALRIRQVLECRLHRIHRAHGGLAAEGFAELEQKIIARGDGGNIYRGSCGRT